MLISHVVFWDFDGTIAQRQNRWSGALLDAWKVVDPTTTATVDLAFFERIVDFAKEHNLMVIHDFAYADYGLDGYEPPSFLQAKGA